MFAPSVPCRRSFAAVDRAVKELAPSPGSSATPSTGPKYSVRERRLFGVVKSRPVIRVRSGVPPTASAGGCRSRVPAATRCSVPGYHAGRSRVRRQRVRRSSARNASFCGQSVLRITICAAMQLWPLLCSRWVAMWRAWKRRSARDHLPGTTMTGAHAAQLAADRLGQQGSARRLAARPPLRCPRRWRRGSPRCRSCAPRRRPGGAPGRLPIVDVAGQDLDHAELDERREDLVEDVFIGSMIGFGLSTATRLSAYSM